MNFLAHARLTPEDPDLLVGNMVTDFLRGRAVVGSLPPAVRRGVALHRLIDRVTDAHPVTRRTIGRIRPVWGRYSPVLVDLFYDHILARDWHRYSDTTLRAFSDHTGAILRRPEYAGLPGMEWVLRVVVEPDRLVSYATIDGIGDALHRISTRRLKRDAGLQRAVAQLREHDDAITADFHELFPELRLAVRRFPEETGD